MQRQLMISEGPDKGRSFDLVEGETLIVGRGSASDTQINDPQVSRVHCHLYVDAENAVVLDQGSAAGTTVNGQPISQHQLQPGDVIQLGETQLCYQIRNEDDPWENVVDIPATSRPNKPQVGQSLAHYRLDHRQRKNFHGVSSD